MATRLPFEQTSEPLELSLAQGGIFFRLARRFQLLPHPENLGSRLVVWTLCLTWLPVVLLLIAQRAITGAWDPLFMRTELHFRMLCSMSCLLWGEWLLEHRVRSVHRHLLEHEFIARRHFPRWRAMLQRISRVRDSSALELGVLFAVYATSAVAYFGLLPAEVLRWLAPTIHQAGVHWSHATPAWWWYMLISQPLFLFVVVRWLSRWLLFAYFMWALARLRPRVEPLHSDRSGGLSFLAEPLSALRFYAVATSIALMSVWLDELARTKLKPAVFASDFIGFMVLSMALCVLPYVPFIRLLIHEKHHALLECSALVDRYTHAFSERWYPPDPERDKELLGHPDFSGLVDLGSSFAVLDEMRTTLPGPRFLKAHAIASMGPFLVILLVYGPPAAEWTKMILSRFMGAE